MDRRGADLYIHSAGLSCADRGGSPQSWKKPRSGLHKRTGDSNAGGWRRPPGHCEGRVMKPCMYTPFVESTYIISANLCKAGARVRKSN